MDYAPALLAPAMLLLPELYAAALGISKRTALIFEGPASPRRPRSRALRDASDRYTDVSNSKPDLRAPESPSKRVD